MNVVHVNFHTLNILIIIHMQFSSYRCYTLQNLKNLMYVVLYIIHYINTCFTKYSTKCRTQVKSRKKIMRKMLLP